MAVREPSLGQKRQSLLSHYVSKKTVAEAFNVSERTIERWVRLRILPAPLRLGRSRLFHLPTIERHLTKLTEAAGGRHRGRAL